MSNLKFPLRNWTRVHTLLAVIGKPGCHPVTTPPSVSLKLCTGVLKEIQSSVCPLFAIIPCRGGIGKTAEILSWEKTLVLVRYMCGCVVSQQNIYTCIFQSKKITTILQTHKEFTHLQCANLKFKPN